MNDKEKFEGFKNKAIKDNEKKYGAEIREKYGDNLVESSNQKVQSMSQSQWDYAQQLSEEIAQLLVKAVNSGDVTGEEAEKMCEKHKEWINLYWADGMYSKEAHLQLASGYVADERFKAYYDDIIHGGAQFIYDALCEYYGE